MDRCPACRARFADSPICGRCGCDFTLVWRAEAEGRRLIRRALRAWFAGEDTAALACAEQARVLCDGPLTQALSRLVVRRVINHQEHATAASCTQDESSQT